MKISISLFCYFIFTNVVFCQNSTKDYRQQAREYGYIKEYKKAIDCYTKIIELNPKGAIKDFTIGGIINPSEPDYFFLRGMLRQKIKDYRNAILDYNKTMTLEFNADAYRFRGQIKEIYKDYKGAMQDYNKALSMNRYSEVFIDRGLLKCKLKDFKGSIEDLNSAIEISPLEENGYYTRAQIYCKIKDYKSAIIDYSKALELNNQQPKYYLKIALLEIKLNEKSNACNDLMLYKKYGGKLKIKLNCN